MLSGRSVRVRAEGFEVDVEGKECGLSVIDQNRGGAQIGTEEKKKRILLVGGSLLPFARAE